MYHSNAEIPEAAWILRGSFMTLGENFATRVFPTISECAIMVKTD